MLFHGNLAWTRLLKERQRLNSLVREASSVRMAGYLQCFRSSPHRQA